MGQATSGSNITVFNKSKHEFIREYHHSYQIESFPPPCFPPTLSCGIANAGRLECYKNCTTGDTGAEAFYVSKSDPSVKVKFYLRYSEGRVEVEGGKVRTDCNHWYRRENGSVQIGIYDK